MYLIVPYVTQLGQRKTANDPTGCWQACARMVHGFALSTGGSSTTDGTRWDFTKNSDFMLPTGSTGSGYWDHPLKSSGLDVPPPSAPQQSSDNWLAAFASREKLAALAGGLPRRPEDLALSLRKWGPLIVCWHKGLHGAIYDHASVVIGVAANHEVIYHDPENAPNSRMNLTAFIGKLTKGSGGNVPTEEISFVFHRIDW